MILVSKYEFSAVTSCFGHVMPKSHPQTIMCFFAGVFCLMLFSIGQKAANKFAKLAALGPPSLSWWWVGLGGGGSSPPGCQDWRQYGGSRKDSRSLLIPVGSSDLSICSVSAVFFYVQTINYSEFWVGSVTRAPCSPSADQKCSVYKRREESHRSMCLLERIRPQ